MPAQRGRDLLLKLDAAASGDFVTVAGLRSNTLSFNAQSVDVTHQQSAGQWRELLAGAGVKSAIVRGNGIFRDEAADAAIRGLFFTGMIRDWQVLIPDFGSITGPFQITELQYAGKHDGEVMFELALESAGALTFAAIP
jgi:TP901-1 family phage major tail protein